MEFIAYTTTGAQPYNESQFVTRQQNCNGFEAVNVGDDIVEINDQVLYPGVPGTSLGDSKTVGGNAGEIYLGQIKISFRGAGANPAVTIDQKYYLASKSLIDHG